MSVQGSALPASQAPGPLQLVSFQVGGEEFGLDILRVQEIIRLAPLTRVPNSPDFLEGVMNLRGKIIPVIALRRRFGVESVSPDLRTRIVVVETQNAVLGFIVDAVSEVLRFSAGALEPPPRLSKVEREYVRGIGKLQDRLIILLDPDRVMPTSEITTCFANPESPTAGEMQ